MSTNSILIIFGLVILAVNAVILLRMKNVSKTPEQDTGGMLLIQNQFNTLSGNLNKLTETLNHKMVESSDKLNESLKYQAGESNKIIRDITERLTRLDETNKQVVSFADQLQSLQDILKNPKQRGVLGEYYLETLLKNVLPPGSFEMQYKIGKSDDGADLIVDAIVRVKDYIIPVDSKFSLENYNRIIEEKDPLEKARLEKTFVGDLKQRILETSKYIRPQDGTTDFAFMFIPHEAIYYDLLVNKIGEVKGEDTENLIQRAANKYKVIIVSPTSFLAYLQTVMQGLKALKIEEEAKNIIKRVDELGKHVQSFETYHTKLGNSLSTTVSHFNASRKELGKIDKDVMRITGDALKIEPVQLDKPLTDSDE
jgi:DNA recombination protein RmuC